MNYNNVGLFRPYGTVNVTFRYGDLHISGASGPATTPSLEQADPLPAVSLQLAPEGLLLSPRQREILLLLVKGHSNKQIARTLGLANGTVKIHVAALFHKLQVTSRTAAAVAGARLLAQGHPLPTSKPTEKADPSYPLGSSNLDVAH